LGGLDTATSGDVLFDEAPLSTLDDDARADLRRHRIGFVFQAFNVVPVLTAAENVSLPAVMTASTLGRMPLSWTKSSSSLVWLMRATVSHPNCQAVSKPGYEPLLGLIH